MRPLPVVEDLDVFEDLGTGALACVEGVVADKFLFQGREEALGHRVVPAVALAAHALTHLVAPESAAKGAAGVLRAAVAVEDRIRSANRVRDRLTSVDAATAPKGRR